MKMGEFSEAVTFYTNAIELDDSVATFYGNRALANVSGGRKLVVAHVESLPFDRAHR